MDRDEWLKQRDSWPLWHVVTGQGRTILAVYGEALLADSQETARRVGVETGFPARVEHIRYPERPKLGAFDWEPLAFCDERSPEGTRCACPLYHDGVTHEDEHGLTWPVYGSEGVRSV